MSVYLDGDAVACASTDAHFVLVEVIAVGYSGDENNYDVSDGSKEKTNNIKYLEPFFVSYAKESVVGIVINSAGRLLKYAALQYVSRYTPTLMAVCGAHIAGNFRCGMSADNHFDFYGNDLWYVTDKHEAMTDEQIYKIIDAMEVSRITADHHLFINKREIMRVVREVRRLDSNEGYVRLSAISIMLSQAKSKDIDNRVSAITHMLYALVAPMFAVEHLMKIWVLSSNAKDYMHMLKLESQAAKQLQTVFRDDLAAVFELQVLRNRVFDSVSWEDEIDHRVNVNAMPISEAQVYYEAVAIFKDARLEGAKARTNSWADYWAGRWSSMPGGSVVSQYEEDIQLKRQLPREAKIKAAWFSANANGDHNYWLTRVPEIYASTSTKYEWGKVRALYGCDVTSFVHSDFAMGDCENMLPSYFPVGRRANDKYIKRIISSFKHGVPFCFDYDDFNSQHSTTSMRAVLRAWLSVFGAELSEEQRMSMQWTIESVNRMTVQFNEVGKTVGVNGTLMSGWRLTSFINTVLNRVYLNKAGLRDNVIYALHNGDDMFATTANMLNAVNVIRNAKAIGIRAQISKTNIGTIGEFLRVDTRATNPTGAQYLARSVATAVHGRVETGAPNDMFALHSANQERIKSMNSRGADTRSTSCLHEELTMFESRLFDVDPAVLELYDNTHPTQGGANVDAAVRGTRLERVTQRTSDSFKLQLAPIDRGIDDYVSLVIRKFGLKADTVSRKNVREKAYDSLSRNKVTYRIVAECDQRAGVYRGLYKAWAKSQYIAPISKLRSVGMANAKTLSNLNGAVVNLVANSSNPIKMMSVIF